ncbi:IS30 family transposase [Falsihalocynthiibacter arcticus]|uniref:IS30 family transposase n=1 Tax=Falsihalocynthiibacter arcticus TaxID=1579316 RepID=UPI001C54C508|nr:IS30 family transposase [Falsihalocynthiibacter arcticus]
MFKLFAGRTGGDHVISCRTKPVMGQIINAIKDLPYVARLSITFDRGTEFASWPHLQAEIGMQTWFCDPASPWQKGTVENTSRRTRRWLPRNETSVQCPIWT